MGSNGETNAADGLSASSSLEGHHLMPQTDRSMAYRSTMTSEESREVTRRVIGETLDRLAVGPLYAMAGGTLSVVIIGLREGATMLKEPSSSSSSSSRLFWTAQQLRFVTRYSIAQVIPSVVWATQPASCVAQYMGVSNVSSLVYANAQELPPTKFLTQNRLMAMRGAIAGSVLLSQVFALMNVVSTSQDAYQQRIRLGKEPPLRDSTQQGVVIRLAGVRSDVTKLTLDRQSRRCVFPVFEKPAIPEINDLLRDHASAQTQTYPLTSSPTSSSSNSHKSNLPKVPIYWHVESGRYSLTSSWAGIEIPQNWLFTVANSDQKLLILEADGSSGQNDACSLRNTLSDELSLYEIAQGFTKLTNLVVQQQQQRREKGATKTSQQPYDVLRVLLVDGGASVASGGGRTSTVRQTVAELGLADVVVDCRQPLVIRITSWLKHQKEIFQSKTPVSKGKKKKQLMPVVLETPEQDWFQSIGAELELHGYRIMDHVQAQNELGSLEGVPFLVYQRTTADTIHTVRQYINRGMVHSSQVCALCPQHSGLDALSMLLVQGVTYISSTDLYDRLLRWVRLRALDGHDAKSIQDDLDSNLETILKIVEHQL